MMLTTASQALLSKSYRNRCDVEKNGELTCSNIPWSEQGLEMYAPKEPKRGEVCTECWTERSLTGQCNCDD